MADYLSLEEAAAKLGISPDRLVELRSDGKVRGFRDGASWKFSTDALDALQEDLAAEDDSYGLDSFAAPPSEVGGSGILVDDAGGNKAGAVIGGDSQDATDSSDGVSSGGDTSSDGELDLDQDVNLGVEAGQGSDLNLIADDGDGTGSDVKLVAAQSSADLLMMDSEELNLGSHDDPSSDPAALDLAIDPKPGSTGSIVEDLGLPSPADAIAGDSDSDVIGTDPVKPGSSDVLSMEADFDGGNSDLALSVDDVTDPPVSQPLIDSNSGDVLSELDLLGDESRSSGSLGGSNVLGSPSESAIGSGISGVSGLGDLSSVDDALGDDDDLVISSDDDDDLLLGGPDSDVSISGDSGINLMSPSDSGLSLESEPLDLAGSSISALDLGAELDIAGSGSGKGSGLQSPSDGGSGSLVDFAADEEFQLSPSAIGGVSVDDDSGSQVIEVEDSAQFGEGVDFGPGGDIAVGNDVFAEDAVVAVEEAAPAVAVMEEPEAAVADPVEVSTAPASAATVGPMQPDVTFKVWDVMLLASMLLAMSICGMLLTDLVCNMWTYTEETPPVSSLTDTLIETVNLDGK